MYVNFYETSKQQIVALKVVRNSSNVNVLLIKVKCSASRVENITVSMYNVQENSYRESYAPIKFDSRIINFFIFYTYYNKITYLDLLQ